MNDAFQGLGSPSTDPGASLGSALSDGPASRFAMPSRRPFGSIRRRRLAGLGPGGKPRYAPGFYVRVRRGGKDIRRYGGADKDTARAYLDLLQRQLDREHLLGESPQNNTTF